MESWPEFNPTRLLRRLVATGVDFVLVGGFAAVAHGATRLTNDIDICFAPDPANLAALAEALDELRATLRGVSEEVPFKADAATLRRIDLLTLDTSEGPLDLLGTPPGPPRYDTLRRRAERIDIGGTFVLVASLDDLISMKRSANRPVDALDVESLEAIKRLRPR